MASQATSNSGSLASQIYSLDLSSACWSHQWSVITAHFAITSSGALLIYFFASSCLSLEAQDHDTRHCHTTDVPILFNGQGRSLTLRRRFRSRREVQRVTLTFVFSAHCWRTELSQLTQAQLCGRSYASPSIRVTCGVDGIHLLL